jgi:hypothetical protein
MRFENDNPTPDDAPAGASDTGSARRRTRAWSTTAPSPREAFDRPSTDRDWLRKGLPPTAKPGEASAPAAQDLPTLVAELTTEVAALRAEVSTRDADRSASHVTGAELAASIEALGNTLGSGLAALLTEHRNLLARDLDSAADRILEEVGQRLRTSSGQTVDAVEDRVRSLTAKALNDLGEQLDLRLDQVQSDVSGLRAVMLEIPDQTVVVGRLDQLAESVGSISRGRESQRVSPALTAAIDKAIAGPIERVEEAIVALGDDLAGGSGGVDSDAINALTKEMTALRRRISLRSDAPVEPAAEDDEIDDGPPAHLAPIRIDEDAPVRKRAPRKAAGKTAGKAAGRRGV